MCRFNSDLPLSCKGFSLVQTTSGTEYQKRLIQNRDEQNEKKRYPTDWINPQFIPNQFQINANQSWINWHQFPIEPESAPTPSRINSDLSWIDCESNQIKTQITSNECWSQLQVERSQRFISVAYHSGWAVPAPHLKDYLLATGQRPKQNSLKPVTQIAWTAESLGGLEWGRRGKNPSPPRLEGGGGQELQTRHDGSNQVTDLVIMSSQTEFSQVKTDFCEY